MDYTVHGILHARILEWVASPLSRDLSSPGIEPRSLVLQANFLPAEPQGKSKNTQVGSLSLLQSIFPIQGSNPGLSYCRQILYQLNHKGNPRILEWVAYPFSKGSSPPRNRTRASCTAGIFKYKRKGIIQEKQSTIQQL